MNWLFDFFSGWFETKKLVYTYPNGQYLVIDTDLILHERTPMNHDQAMAAHQKASVLHSRSTVQLQGEEPYWSLHVYGQQPDTKFHAIDNVPIYYHAEPPCPEVQ